MQKFKCLFLQLTLIFSSLASANAETSVSQWGITWTWTQDLPVGQFANGDYYVVAPSGLTLTGPVSSGARNGSMLNPTYTYWPSQGFDDSIADLGYNASLNIGTQLPKSILPNSSIVSSISRTSTDGRNNLKVIAILTVLPSAPAAGSFRPTYYGNDKTIKWNKSQINYNRLQRLAPLAGAPTVSSLATAFAHAQFLLGGTYKRNYIRGYDNSPVPGGNYGREDSLMSAKAGLVLNCNYTDAQKEPLAINFIQYGLDCYEGVVRGQKFYAEGGQTYGQKLPTIIAGWLLNDTDIISVISTSGGTANANFPAGPSFAEDQAHFYVTQNDINLPRYVSSYQPADPYPQSALGMPEWGPGGGYPDNAAGYNWGRAYRDVACANLVGNALTVKIMGVESQWNDPAFFDYYTQRFFPAERNGGKIDPWFVSMWDAYSGSSPSPTVAIPVLSPAGGNYPATQNVTISTNTSGATIRFTTDGSTPSSTTGTVYSSPLVISASSTIKAIAYKSGSTDSSVLTSAYVIGPPPVATPAVNPPAGSYAGTQNVTIATATSGATIRYTTDGSTPSSTTGTVYSSPLAISASSTIKAIAYMSGSTDSSILTAAYVIGPSQVATPTVNPPAGNYAGTQNVTITTATSGATIRYTLDGTTPTSSTGTTYSGPVTIGSTSTLKAVAYKSGSLDSSIVSAGYNIGDYVTPSSAPTSWVNIPLGQTFTSGFTVEWDALPSAGNVDVVMGLSNGSVSNWSQVAATARFTTAGKVDAMNGAVYAADSVFNYVGNSIYKFRLLVNRFSPGTFDLFVKGASGTEVQIADDFAFRTQTGSVTQLDTLALNSPVGSVSVSNIKITPSVPQVPTPPQGLRIVNQ